MKQLFSSSKDEKEDTPELLTLEEEEQKEIEIFQYQLFISKQGPIHNNFILQFIETQNQHELLFQNYHHSFFLPRHLTPYMPMYYYLFSL